MPHAFLCDFDGTISPSDIGAALVQRFSPGRDAERRAVLEAWKSGSIGHRELTEAECRMMRVGAEEALAFTRGFELDPHFATFVREAEGRGERVAVVSEGFEFYVRDQLSRAGLSRIPAATNRLCFEPDGHVVAEFPHGQAGCGRCGNCKGEHVRRHQAEGFHVVLVGDGLSDRCGARSADRVMARGALLEWCRNEGVPAEPFASFADVALRAHGWAAATAARG